MTRCLWICVLLVSALGATSPAPAEEETGGWRPAPAAASAPVEAARVRVVDCGTDFLRDGDGRPKHQFHVHRWAVRQDPETKLYRVAGRVQQDRSTDVDGDGESNDDVAACHAFSLTRPFSPDAPWYDSLAGSPRWYGGAAIYQANRRETGFSEDGVNHEHDGPMYLPRDNWALFHETYEVFGPYRLGAAWIWKKEDFLNGGAEFPVSLDAKSEMALYLQRYFMGIDAVRFLLQEGEQFYVSERIFRGAGQQEGQANGRQHVLCPAETRWAKYNPKPPHNIWFDAKEATFMPRTFRDVRAAGFYVAKDRWRPAYFGFKWYAFECDAVVARKARPSESTAMKRVPGSDAVPPFWVSSTPVAYELWKKVFRLARSNTFVRDPRGFIFDRDGDVGAMDSEADPQSPDEPVTDVSLHDVAAWCNALSQQEGKMPCYYEDDACTTVFRYVKRSPLYGPQRPLQELHVRWRANGYRLATPAEWQAADIVPNRYWKYVWTGQTPTIIAGTGPKTAGLFTFHVIRREADLAAPAQGEVSPQVPQWRNPTQKKPSSNLPAKGLVQTTPVAGTGLAFAVTETTYDQWRRVRDWALGNGFTFDSDGDLGSMDYWGMADGWGSPRAHNSSEPVTDVTFYDVAAWCNALSEVEGRTCVYYADPKCTKVYRQAFVYRPLMQLFFETGRDQDAGLLPKDRMLAVGRIYTKPGADGYRIPTAGEFDKARLAGQRTRYSWGNDPTGVFEHAWLFDNSGGGTHAVGRKKPNPAGLFDMEGNVSELCAGDGPKWDVVSGVGVMPRCGGSFLDLTWGVGRGKPPRTPAGWGYPDVGFRVVRETDRQSRLSSDGRQTPFFLYVSEEGEAKPDVEVKPGEFDDLQGRAHRGNLRRDGVFDAAGVPQEPAFLWKFRTGGPVRSSPVVVGSVAYVGSNDGRIYAIDASKGTEIWQHRTGGAVAGSAAVVHGVVYIVSEDGCLYALEADSGKRKWRVKLSNSFQPCGSPAPAYGAVFVAAGARGGHSQGTMSAGPIIALNAESGERIWTGPGGPQGYAGLCLDAATLYAGSNGSNFQAVDLATGRGIWTRNAGHQNRQWTSMTRHGELVYAPGAMAGTVQAWDPKTGELKWQQPVWPQQKHPLNNQGEPGHEVMADLAVADGCVYAACNDGALQTFDAVTGKRGWRRELGGSIQSSPSVAGKTVYFGCWDGNLYALATDTGKTRWRYKPSPLPAPDWTVDGKQRSARIISSPWIGEGVLYVGCDDGYVYALKEQRD
jgi:outer membrane protein assembly factor BamB/formylglycine-generating enzyme required for sulfatase activity